MRWLAILLFAPWFAILVWAYWSFPRSLPRTSSRRAFDAIVIVATLVASVLAMLHWHDVNVGIGASIWKQVAASTAIYGAFLGVLLAAVLVRSAIWSTRRR